MWLYQWIQLIDKHRTKSKPGSIFLVDVSFCKIEAQSVNHCCHGHSNVLSKGKSKGILMTQALMLLVRIDLLAECRILLLHGLLHLVGFDHDRSQEDWIEMAQAEEKIMGILSWEGKGLIKAANGSGLHPNIELLSSGARNTTVLGAFAGSGCVPQSKTNNFAVDWQQGAFLNLQLYLLATTQTTFKWLQLTWMVHCCPARIRF